MAGIRGTRNPLPKKGGKAQNLFSGNGKQSNPPLGDGFKPNLTATAMDKPRVKPVKRNNGLK